MISTDLKLQLENRFVTSSVVQRIDNEDFEGSILITSNQLILFKQENSTFMHLKKFKKFIHCELAVECNRTC